MPPALIVFSGLPGVGKTTIARALAARLGAMYLRIDAIEQAIRQSGIERVGAAGYAVANALAQANLALGLSVVADCVNPVRESRQAWRAVAARASARLLDVHLVCSDAVEHRRRVEHRRIDIPGHRLPDCNAVTTHDFEPRDDNPIVFDTATRSPDEIVALCAARLC